MFLARRRKGIFSLFLLASFVIFCTWLLQIKFEDFHDDHPNLKQFIIENNQHHKELKLEIHAHERELLLANIVTAHADDIKIKRVNKISNEFAEANIELKSLFKLMHNLNAFLADLTILKEVSLLVKNDDSNDMISEFQIDYEYYKNLLKSKDFQITFGIHTSSLDYILSNKDNLKSNYNLNCQIIESVGSLYSKNVQTNTYLNCTYMRIQLSVFYSRNEFLWIGKDESFNKLSKWFGDIPRAMNNFNLSLLNTKSVNFILVPSNIKKFLFDYNVSKFLECNRTLADTNLRKMGEKYKPNVERNNMLLPVMSHISKTLEGLYKRYWLAGGTLLGWYRDCGIIPHTQDVDFAIFANEYETKIKKAFLGNKIVRVWGTLGMVNDSYEFRMYNDLFTFDMFLVYDYNSTYNWCGYQVNKVKFRRWLPKLTQLCSGELLNNKFMIPCDPVEYLNKEYGKRERWVTPLTSNYTWSNVNHWKSWSEDEWPYVIKYYDKSGQLIKSKVLSYLNKHSKRNITEVPSEPD